MHEASLDQSFLQQSQSTSEYTHPFYSAAHVYHQAGMTVIPCRGNNGKVACVKWGDYRHAQPSADQIKQWRGQFPDSNIGLVTGPASGLTVVDIDTSDQETVRGVIEAFGDTPVKVTTPSGGLHLFYSYNSEGSHTRIHNWPVDIRAAGGYVIAPPSVHPETLKSYRFIEGGFDHLNLLPFLKSGALPQMREGEGAKPDILGGEIVEEGQRNSALFRALIKSARDYACMEELEDRAFLLNQIFIDPPLPDEEVEQILYNAWRTKVSNQLYCGRERFVTVIGDEVYNLQDQPRALWLLMYLKNAHIGKRENFAVSPKAIADKTGWDRSTVRYARDILIHRQYLECIHVGGKHPGDFSQYRFQKGEGAKPAQ